MAQKLIAKLEDKTYLVIALIPGMVENPDNKETVHHTIMSPEGLHGFHLIKKSFNELIEIVEKPGYKWFVEDYDDTAESWCERKEYADELFS